VLFVFLLLLAASLGMTLVGVFFSFFTPLLYLHINSFTTFAAILVGVILRLMVRSLRFAESQLAVFGELKLELTDQVWASTNPSTQQLAKPESSYPAHRTKQLQLSISLLDHISHMVAVRGTPFRLFGVQVSGNVLKALFTLGVGAVVTMIGRLAYAG
jgi:hypothetical protein